MEGSSKPTLNTNNKIVFYFDKTTNRFNMGHYDPTMTNGKLSIKDLANFLAQMSKIAAKSNIQISKRKKILLFVTYFIVFLGIVCGVPRLFRGGHYLGWYVLSIIIMLILFCVLCGYIINAKEKAKKAVQVAKIEADMFLVSQKPFFAEKGLRWYEFSFPDTLELIKDYMAANSPEKNSPTYEGHQQGYSHNEIRQSNNYIPPDAYQNQMYMGYPNALQHQYPGNNPQAYYHGPEINYHNQNPNNIYAPPQYEYSNSPDYKKIYHHVGVNYQSNPGVHIRTTYDLENNSSGNQNNQYML